MIDDGVGFQPVPWQPVPQKQIGRHISGVFRDELEWSLGRRRDWGFSSRCPAAAGPPDRDRPEGRSRSPHFPRGHLRA
ncbi:DUF3363 domain-containing protein [Ancylobacter sp. 3268]|uniref:DUF3363 domain-containing protein n=1 Tax=Ancylobacter sp. 3268 TaxID=2817752 RepID=UPI00286B6AAD|nr:DUF3363 domain-containing protein [Ancylobacter sp. 3268]